MAKKNIFEKIWTDKYSREIEQSAKRNISKISPDVDLKKIHAKIAKILKAHKQKNNEYLEYENFHDLVMHVREQRALQSETKVN